MAGFIAVNNELRLAQGDPVKITYAQLEILKTKRLLLRWYEYIYEFMAESIVAGRRNLEIGSGASLLYERIPYLIKSNILVLRGNDLAFSALNMPFKDNTFDNIILIDVFHHLDDPAFFIEEAKRTLRNGGRLLLCDPYLSCVSFMLWKYLHPEGCDTSMVGFKKENINSLLDANSASATNIFCRDLGKLNTYASGFKVIDIRYHTKFYYWLAGGYNFPQFLPTCMSWLIDFMESAFSRLNKFMASFLFVVLEKN